MEKIVIRSREDCIKYLTDIGMFINVNGLELYHGRSRMSGEDTEWQVRADFNNADNATGNRNVNSISTLYLADREIAARFADTRARQTGGTPEVHRIISSDNNAVVFNTSFSMLRFSSEERVKINLALKELSMYSSVTEYAPIKFEQREQASKIIGELKEIQKREDFDYFHNQDILDCIQSLLDGGSNVDSDTVYRLAESFNARKLMRINPRIAVDHFLSQTPLIESSDCGNFKINLDWVASWLVNNNVIGGKQRVLSATLSEEIDTYCIFDKERINTSKVVGDKLQAMMNEFGQISVLLSNFTYDEELKSSLAKSSPKETLELVKKSPYYAKIMDMSSYVWEGFTVGEHTESVLRVLKDSFESDIPSNLIPFLKVVILSHDLGKGYARGNGNQHEYTRALLPHFHQSLKIPSKVSKLIEFITIDSQEFTSDYYVRHNKYAQFKLQQEASRILNELTGVSPSDELVRGLMGICKILQTCDSGAYTRYGITRDSKTGYFYYNGNDRFTGAIKKPSDLRGVKQRFEFGDTLDFEN